MQWALANQSVFFFNQHGYVRLEGVYKENFANQGAAFWAQGPEKVFMGGRDLWRKERTLISLSKVLPPLIYELTNVKPLYLSSTQYLKCVKAAPPPLFSSKSFEALVKNPLPLAKMSCFQGVVAGCLVCLKCDEGASWPELFPQQPGEISLFTPKTIVPLDCLYGRGNAQYALIVFCNSRAVYINQPCDPHAHDLKKWGYNYGDRLLSVDFPLL